MEISISIEPYLSGDIKVLREYLDNILRLRGKIPVSVHYDCFEYKPEIIMAVGEYADKIAVHLHSMLPGPKSALPLISKYPFASVSVHNDNQHIVDIMNITNTIYSKGIVFDLPVFNIDDYADIIKKCGYATVMTVLAGASGRPFDGSALSKIDKIKDINPDIKIIIDGGINDRTIFELSGKAVDIAVMGSYAKRCYETGGLLNGLQGVLTE